VTLLIEEQPVEPVHQRGGCPVRHLPRAGQDPRCAREHEGGSPRPARADRNPAHRETLTRALRWVYAFEMSRGVMEYRKNLDKRGPVHLKEAVRD